MERPFQVFAQLEARPHDIMVAELAKGARLIASGILGGLLASFWLTRLLQQEPFDTSRLNPIVWLGAALLLAAVGLPACYPSSRFHRAPPDAFLLPFFWA